MHPDLAPHLHPHCVDVISMYEKCHADNKWKKFFGVCEDFRLKVQDCLYEEYLINSKANREKAMVRRAAYELKAKEFQEAAKAK
eukprot:m.170005 g.170005  ORF g.170005 m.170005 type:complete len:84 (-) comp53240_c0_seq5:840-1091(-)